MSSENVEQFKQFVLANPEIQANLRAVSDQKDFLAQIKQIAKSHNYELTDEELEAELNPGGEELSTEQLEAVAGGQKPDRCYITCGTCTVSYMP